MFAQVLIVTFVFCLGLTVASVLVSRQLLSTYASEFLRHHFYYLAAFHAFAFYGLWGQILTRSAAGVDRRGCSRRRRSWRDSCPCSACRSCSCPGSCCSAWPARCSARPSRRHGSWLHAAVFLLLLLGAWLAVPCAARPSPGRPIANLGLIEAVALIVVELLYFSAFRGIRRTLGRRL